MSVYTIRLGQERWSSLRTVWFIQTDMHCIIFDCNVGINCGINLKRQLCLLGIHNIRMVNEMNNGSVHKFCNSHSNRKHWWMIILIGPILAYPMCIWFKIHSKIECRLEIAVWKKYILWYDNILRYSDTIFTRIFTIPNFVEQSKTSDVM